MISLFLGALIFSIWFTILFFEKNIGLSMLLFVVPITYFIVHILEKNQKIENSKAKILIIPITLLSATYFIYNNKFFNTLNLFIIPILLIFMIFGLFKEKLKFNLVSILKILGIVFNPLNYVSEAFEKLSIYFKVKLNLNIIESKNSKKIFKALAITIPIVIFIIILLATADEEFKNIFASIFASLVNSLSKIDLAGIILRLILIVCCSFYLFLLFYYISNIYEKDDEGQENKSIVDTFTMKMILTSLNIVYLVFCIIQVRTLIIRNNDINYAYYARQGFFQLMIVSIINLITILIAKKGEKTDKYINSMCLIMIVFTFAILIFSAIRMYFYESIFGYTLLRLLVYCSLATEAILLIPTIMYVLDKKIDLSKTYFGIVLTIYVLMNLSNLDNIIAKRNVDRYLQTGKIDMYYLEQEIGTDAVNQILRILEYDNTEDVKKEAENYLNRLYIQLNSNNMDFREFNLSKFLSKSLIEKGLK